MNYYTFHVGDWASATAHLTLLESGVYRALIDLYYTREGPLPEDKRALYRLLRASSAAERQAVDTILGEFFTLTQNGYTNSRCDEELAKYRAASSKSAERREHEAERQRRHRERRADLFAELRARGVTPKWDVTTAELERLAAEPVTGDRPASHAAVTPPVTPPDTANPLPITHYPRSKEENPSPRSSLERRVGTPAGALARALKAKGVQANPFEPRLMALAAAGVTEAEAEAAAQAAREAKGPDARIPAAYVCGILERWQADPGARPAGTVNPADVAAEAMRMLDDRERHAEIRTA